MKVYIVVKTDGDWIGWFESDVLGVFTQEKDAIKCKEKHENPLYNRIVQIYERNIDSI